MSNGNFARVDVALATYNGARFLNEQLDSLVAQTYPIHIVASDDGSSDGTTEILRQRSEHFPLTVCYSDSRRGPLRNFENAIRHCEANYIALADQDDVWNPQKISLLYDRIVALERKFTPEIPILVFCDLEIVDSNLVTISSSFFAATNKCSRARHFSDFILNNHVPGCAMLFNRALVEVALPFPDVEIHDHWLVQVAALLGHVDYVDAQLVRYRQHSSNSIGLGSAGIKRSRWAWRSLRDRLLALKSRRHRWRAQANAVRTNVTALSDRYRSASIDPRDGQLMDAVLTKGSNLSVARLLRNSSTGERFLDQVGVIWALKRISNRT